VKEKKCPRRILSKKNSVALEMSPNELKISPNIYIVGHRRFDQAYFILKLIGELIK
jgi:hypothetical protein